MEKIGNIIRAYRLKSGYSLKDISKGTKIANEKFENIENGIELGTKNQYVKITNFLNFTDTDKNFVFREFKRVKEKKEFIRVPKDLYMKLLKENNEYNELKKKIKNFFKIY